MFEEIATFVQNIINWLLSFLPGMPSVQFPSGVPITLLVVGSLLLAFIGYTLVKSAGLAVAVLVGLGAEWLLLKDLTGVVLFAAGGISFSALDLVMVGTIVLGALALGKLKK